MKTLYILLIASAVAFAKPQSAASDHFQTGIGKLYAGYLDIQQALSKDDFQKSKAGAISLYGWVKAVPTTGLDKPTKSHWDSGAASMMKVQHLMATSKNIDTLRTRFMTLTPLVVDAIEKFGMKPASPAYLFHCPMANADWLQKDKNKANPFYGKSMSECGSLVREVKSR